MAGSDSQASPPWELNAIACRRCRQKKIRCDREKPDCKRCRQVSAECLYDPRKPRKRTPRPAPADMATATQVQNSHLLNIMNRLDALENGSRSTTESPAVARPSEVSSRSPRDTQAFQSTPGTGRPNTNLDSDPSEIHLKGYRFNSTESGSVEKLLIDPEIAKSWLQMLYDNQNSLGLLLPIAKDFMLTIPSIVDNPYVQIDVRVLILFYGALHQGMLLSLGIDTSKKSEYSTLLYRKALRLMGEWQHQEQINELSLHVAFWMTFETYSQSDFDLSHKLHRCACDIARALGLLDLDGVDGSAPSPATIPRPGNIDAVYRGAHRIYFWQILMMYDSLFRNNLYRRGNIEIGTWKVSLPDLSTWRTFSDGDRDTQVYFEVSLRLARISLRYSELQNNVDLRLGGDGVLDAPGRAEVMDLVLEIGAVFSKWNIEPLLMQASLIHAYLYAKLIWDASSMITSFLRIQPRSPTWPPDNGSKLELDAARRSITAAQRLFELDPNGPCWHLGYFKSYITPCIGVIFRSILTTGTEETIMSNITLTLWIDMVLTECGKTRKGLYSMRMFVRTLRRFSHIFIQQNVRGAQLDHGQEPSALSEAMRRGVVEDILDISWQTSESKSPLPGSPSEVLGEEELQFLNERGVDIQQLYDNPCQAIMELERSLLTEPDPHCGWWTFDP